MSESRGFSPSLQLLIESSLMYGGPLRISISLSKETPRVPGRDLNVHLRLAGRRDNTEQRLTQRSLSIIHVCIQVCGEQALRHHFLLSHLLDSCDGHAHPLPQVCSQAFTTSLTDTRQRISSCCSNQKPVACCLPL